MIVKSAEYDVAVSFSGAQRVQVEKVVRACQRLGVTVFYDRDHIVDFWGQDVITALREIYSGARAQYYTIDQLAQSIAARVGVAPKRNRFPSAAPGSSSRTVRATRSSIKPELLDPPMARPSTKPPPDHFLTPDVGNDLPSSDADARRRAERKRHDDQRGG